MKQLRLILIPLILSVSSVRSVGQTAEPAPPSGKPLAITPTPRTENPGWMKIVERQAAATKFAILDMVNPRGHPVAADESLVQRRLVVGGALHRSVVQPDVGDVKAGEDAIRCGFPGDAKQDGLAVEGFLPFSRPRAFGDQVFDYKAFATTPDAGGSIEGHFFLSGFAIASVFRLARCDDHACGVFDLHFLELPGQHPALAVAGLVFEQEDMILGGEDACAAIVIGIAVPSGMSRRSADEP